MGLLAPSSYFLLSRKEWEKIEEAEVTPNEWVWMQGRARYDKGRKCVVYDDAEYVRRLNAQELAPPQQGFFRGK